ncbi:DMT family transporter [Methanolobus halotolerans]|uniref:EamA family transporter n=1 Tax=Methanolobus halotolerans TaxID=2052935 RepID=A0A4E0PY43_9EURY|nr:DMT family transporter [Methanolobus halotolerans]TGC09789.1 EamA family transporter [Methanolobus halotolerans]
MELSTVIFGLGAAACWGAGDFCGGIATKRSGALAVAIVSQIVGALLLASSALIIGEVVPSMQDILWGALGGISGGIGILALYHALSASKMGVVAPVAAVSSAIIPVTFGIALEGLPANSQILGFIFAFIGVWFISREEDGSKINLYNLRLPLVAGLGFGLFMIFIDRIQGDAILWPLVGARIASLIMFCLAAIYMKKTKVPVITYFPLMIFAGVLDTGGNLFYALAAQAGRLDIAAVLTSLYPALTVLMAWILLKERLAQRQWLGVLSVMMAVVLIA